MIQLKWEGSVYKVKELNAKEYMAIEGIIRVAKGLEVDEPLSMDGGDFTAGLIVACTTKDDEPVAWDDVGKMSAKLFQAISGAANKLNTLLPKEEQALFFESSMEGAA